MADAASPTIGNHQEVGKALLKILGLSDTQLAALVRGLVMYAVDVDGGDLILGPNGPISAESLLNPTADSLGATIGEAMTTLEAALVNVQGTPNQVIVDSTTIPGTLVYKTPQDIAATSSPTFHDVRTSQNRNASRQPKLYAPGTGAGTGPTVVTQGNDQFIYLDLTTGTACAANQSVIGWNFAEAFPAGYVPFILVHPINPMAWDRQNTANKALSPVNVTETGFALAVGSNALADATNYKFIIEIVGVR